MTQTTISCPHCGKNFSLSDIQNHEMNAWRKQFEAEKEAEKSEWQKKLEAEKSEWRKKAKEFAEQEVKKAKEDAKNEMKGLQMEVENLRKRDEENAKKELEFLKKQQEWENKQRDAEIEKQKLIAETERKTREEMDAKNQKFLEEKMKEMQEESAKIIKAKDEQMAQIQKSLNDAERKAQQGSMQIQGEYQEKSLKEMLAKFFPIDTISDVEKGIRGADIIQEVKNEFGQSVGIIAWESKNTKNWEDKWIEKIKEDRLRVNANISVIVSQALPKNVEKFGIYDGIWIVDWRYAKEIAMILRNQMIEIAAIQNSYEGREERLEILFDYLTSAKFKNKIENILTAFQEMQKQVADERKAFEARWKKREALLENVIKNTSGMYGDLSGILGAKLQKIDYLELPDGNLDDEI